MYQGCAYFFLGGAVTRVVSNDCNFSTPRLNDGGIENIHNGGDLFIFNGRLALANGETNFGALLARSQYDHYYAGKVLYVDDLSIVGAGLSHSWSAAAIENGSVAIADVGHSHSEDLSILVEAGTNFGWPMIEGALALTPWTHQSTLCTKYVLPSFFDYRPTSKDDVLGFTWSMFGVLLVSFVLEWYFWKILNILLPAAALTLCPRIAVVPHTYGYVNFASISTIPMGGYQGWTAEVIVMTTFYTVVLALCLFPKWWAGIPLVLYMVIWGLVLPSPWVLTVAAYMSILAVVGATGIFFVTSWKNKEYTWLDYM